MAQDLMVAEFEKTPAMKMVWSLFELPLADAVP